jgi:(p)ppGpp synthase/HD superfamily hydrolase
MENKETFQARVQPHLAPSAQLDVKLAYCLGKFGHRAQFRHELTEGKPTRYFEHVRRVAIILMDEMKIVDRDMIIAALLHDSLEDTKDLTPELLEHCFGSHVVHIVKLLSKVPKTGYIDRLAACYEWEILAIKACDRLDNLRSLMIPENSYEFKCKQIKETLTYYCPVFDNLVRLAPKHHHKNVLRVVREIKRLVKEYSVQLKIEYETGKCLICKGSGYGRWRNEEDFTLCESCKGSGKNKDLTT